MVSFDAVVSPVWVVTSVEVVSTASVVTFSGVVVFSLLVVISATVVSATCVVALGVVVTSTCMVVISSVMVVSSSTPDFVNKVGTAVPAVLLPSDKGVCGVTLVLETSIVPDSLLVDPNTVVFIPLSVEI